MNSSLGTGDPGVADHRSPWRFLIWTARAQAPRMIACAVLAISGMLCLALTPAVLGRAIDTGITARDGGALVTWSAVLLALGCVQAAFSVLEHRLSVMNWLDAAYRTVQLVTRQSTRLGATLPKRLTTGEVVSVGVADIADIGGAIDVVARAVGAVVAIVVVTGLMLTTSVQLGLVVLIGMPLVLALGAPLLRPFRIRRRRQRELIGLMNTRVTDLVAGLRVLRGVGGERLFADRFRQDSQRVRRSGDGVARAESMLSGAEILLPGLLVALVTWLGARSAMAGDLTAGQLIACYGYAAFLLHPVKIIGEAADRITRGHVAAGRVVRILAVEPECRYAGSRVPRAPADLVDPASGLRVPAGLLTVIAADPVDADRIAGRLGGYPVGRPTEQPEQPEQPRRHADVTYDGIPLHEVEALRARILVAINDDRLFTGRLADELAGPSAAGPGTTAGALHHPLHVADAMDVVEEVGLDAHVTEAGREFSGGQRQRLRLARALAADPEVLILVEPTSAVDAHTEARIAERLHDARAGRTTVVCSTSPLVLDRADHVVYVEDGEVRAAGTHHELLTADPRYLAMVTR